MAVGPQHDLSAHVGAQLLAHLQEYAVMTDDHRELTAALPLMTGIPGLPGSRASTGTQGRSLRR